MEKSHVAALRLAVEITGSQAALAEALAAFLKRPSVKQQLISYWLNNGTFLEAVWWPAFEYVTDNRVTREQLRPDVFRRSKTAVAAVCRP